MYHKATNMVSNEEIREFADEIQTDNLPRDGTYKVMAARPTSPTEAVTDEIEGFYHALYARDEIMDKKGDAGVSFHVEEV